MNTISSSSYRSQFCVCDATLKKEKLIFSKKLDNHEITKTKLKRRNQDYVETPCVLFLVFKSDDLKLYCKLLDEVILLRMCRICITCEIVLVINTCQMTFSDQGVSKPFLEL